MILIHSFSTRCLENFRDIVATSFGVEHQPFIPYTFCFQLPRVMFGKTHESMICPWQPGLGSNWYGF